MKKELQLKRPRNSLLNRYADIISEGRFSRELGHVRHGSQLPSHWAGQLVALRRRQVPRSRACTEDGRRVYVSIIYSEWDARRAAQSRAAYRSPTVWLFWPPQRLREPRNRFSDQHRYKRRGDESPGRVDSTIPTCDFSMKEAARFRGNERSILCATSWKRERLYLKLPVAARTYANREIYERRSRQIGSYSLFGCFPGWWNVRYDAIYALSSVILIAAVTVGHGMIFWAKLKGKVSRGVGIFSVIW